MCTIGAKILQPGREFILFKNRDFTRSSFEDRVRLNSNVFGALGLETWDGTDPATDRFSGFSIGFNDQLACCDSNVRMLPGGESYDVLVEDIVENCRTVNEAIAYVERTVYDRHFSWGNLLVGTAHEVVALEVREHHVEVERSPFLLVRSNHHVCLGATPDDDDRETSALRYQTAHEGLEGVERLNDVFVVLRSHTPDSQRSICNHGIYDTVYSYVIHWRDGDISLHVHQGHPCDRVPYTCIPFRFGIDTDLSAYPSAYVS